MRRGRWDHNPLKPKIVHRFERRRKNYRQICFLQNLRFRTIHTSFASFLHIYFLFFPEPRFPSSPPLSLPLRITSKTQRLGGNPNPFKPPHFLYLTASNPTISTQYPQLLITHLLFLLSHFSISLLETPTSTPKNNTNINTKTTTTTTTTTTTV